MPTCNLNYPILFEVWLTCEVAFLRWLEVYCFVFSAGELQKQFSPPSWSQTVGVFFMKPLLLCRLRNVSFK